MYRRIRDMREDADLLQKDVADYLQCTQVSYSHYELGKRDIPTDVLIKLASFYQTSTDYLLGLTDEKKALSERKGIIEEGHFCVFSKSVLFIKLS